MNNRRQCGHFHFEEDTFARNGQGISIFFHEVLLMMKFPQTKPQVRIIIQFIMLCSILLLKLEIKMK